MLAVETHDLGYRPGRGFALQHIEMRVPVGAVYGFLGPNGAGKTTTIRLLLGFLRPHAGTITVLGERMPKGYPAVLARAGYVPERPHIYPGLTVTRAIALHAAFHPTWDANRATELLRQFGLAADRRVGALSKGETGKLMMLLALAQQPALLVLDEPTDGLDPVVRREVLRALLEYVSTRGATVLISSHLVHELERICDWIAVMDRGRMVMQLPVRELKDGVKRIRMARAPAETVAPPFTILSRETVQGAGVEWIVQGWRPEMLAHLTVAGGEVHEIVDLDLEEGFVEVLRSFRNPEPRRGD